MRWNRLTQWVAGALAGCPGTVDISAEEDPLAPLPAPRVGAANPAADSCATQRPRRNGWVTAAALILGVQGLIGLASLPVLTGGSPEQIQPFLILLVTVSVLNLSAGIGLFRLRGWARFLAGLIAAVELAFIYAPALVVTVPLGIWPGFYWLSLGGFLVVLFAVLRRWPTGQGR